MKHYTSQRALIVPSSTLENNLGQPPVECKAQLDFNVFMTQIMQRTAQSAPFTNTHTYTNTQRQTHTHKHWRLPALLMNIIHEVSMAVPFAQGQTNMNMFVYIYDVHTFRGSIAALHKCVSKVSFCVCIKWVIECKRVCVCASAWVY